jgi:hypothetical protein
MSTKWKNRRAPVSTSNALQDLPGLRETADNTEHYTGCPRRKGQYFGKVFLMLNYTDITQNTYVKSLTVTEIMAIEKWGFCGVDILYAVPDAILVHCACPATRHHYALQSAQGSSDAQDKRQLRPA